MRIRLKENNENIKEIPFECIKGATLLSVEEAEELLTREERKCEYNGKSCSWWLRTPGYNSYGACYVYSDGSVGYRYPVDGTGGVRPALILNLTPEILKSKELEVGGFFEFGGYDFKIISKNLALCEEIIGKCTFREDYEAEDANVYEKSDVKKYVDNWFDNEENKQLGYKTDDEIFNDDFDF